MVKSIDSIPRDNLNLLPRGRGRAGTFLYEIENENLANRVTLPRPASEKTLYDFAKEKYRIGLFWGSHP